MIKVLFSAVLFLFTSVAFAQNLRVLDKDVKGKGVECEIKITRANGKIELVSYTDDKGWVQVDFKCGSIENVTFIPKGDYFSKTTRCPVKEKEIYVSSISYRNNLVNNARFYSSVGDYGTSALAFNEAIVRLKVHDENASQKLEKELYVTAGKAFGVERPIVFDSLQGKEVISIDLHEAIIKYQKGALLKSTGNLDFSTLRSISNKDLGTLFKAPK